MAPASRRCGPAPWLLVALVVAGLAHGCATSRAPGLSAEAAAWSEGPVRCLLMQDERRQLGRLRTAGELAAFREAFWRRRDPTPDDPANPAQTQFLERVEIADRLYDEGDLDGSRSDRGRAFLLLGAPSRLRLGPATELGAGGGDPAGRGAAAAPQVETWGWVAEDLDPELRRRLPAPTAEGEWRVAFRRERAHARLIAGEALLEAAAAAWVVETAASRPTTRP